LRRLLLAFPSLVLFRLHLLKLVPPPRAWSDLEISQFKEGVIVHGWMEWMGCHCKRFHYYP
jgi:hypothetical protein